MDVGVLDRVRALRSKIGERAEAIEIDRRLPDDMVDALRRCGVFRMFTPVSHGGLELALPVALNVLAELAAADGAVGWVAMIGCVGPFLFAGLPRTSFDAIYAASPDVIQAGSTVPVGVAERTPGGFRVTGRWPFASGCQSADWLNGLCRVMEDGPPIAPTNGEPPALRFIFRRAEEWRIEDTWRVSGLRGTGSHHIALDGCFVPEEFTHPWPPTESCVNGPLFGGVGALVPLVHASVALGLAIGARQDLLDMAASGRRQLRATSTMADSPIFHYEFAQADADLAAARAYLETRAAEVWRLALSGALSNRQHWLESQQACVWITTACERAIDKFYALGGGAAIYDSSPLQRRLRDIRAAAQHIQAQPRQYEAIGREYVKQAIAGAAL
jgi:alkylation response protein AidB-like acyl-CoA dehydrogenase